GAGKILVYSHDFFIVADIVTRERCEETFI
ncbi:MAG: hypothetical protein ACI90V_002985, partial [Bacillariaceae sp.]